jgi:hypothetical protein
MTGGLMQLVSYGSQDIYLTGNPQMTFFKFVYKRHTNFAIEQMEQSYIGSALLGRKITCNIARDGDLLYRLYLELEYSNQNIEDEYFGFQLIDYIDLEIGSQLIQRLPGEWMMLWYDLTNTYDKMTILDDMVSVTAQELYIPLPLFFCRNAGSALPLVALQYHDVKLHIYFKNAENISNSGDITKCSIWCDYIFLDTDERKLFAKRSHEYLIEQVQFVSTKIDINKTYYSQDLKFAHPVKELIWVIQDVSGDSKYYIDRYEQVVSANITMNGIDRFKKRKGKYFVDVQRYEYHTGVGIALGLPYTHIYSFSLYPDDLAPSGTCNFSRLNNVTLNIDLSQSNMITDLGNFSNNTAYRLLNVYAPNYNVLRIMSGMGGLAYSL